MTAIDKYIRLEAVGQWKETPESTVREVIVSFGDATLVLSDMKENPQSHWAFAGMQRLSLDGTKAIYTTDTQGFETLEIDDADMVEAISQVSRLVLNKKTKPRPRFGRWIVLGLVVAGVIAAAPTAIRYQAHAMTSPESTRYFGYKIIETAGIIPCGNTDGNAARDIIVSRVFTDDTHRLIVTESQLDASIYPGGLIVLGLTGLQSFLTPEDLANWLKENEKYSDTSLSNLFETAPLKTLVSYISSGELPAEQIDELAKGIALNDSATPLSNAGGLSETDILRDQEWQDLRQICLN